MLQMRELLKEVLHAIELQASEVKVHRLEGWLDEADDKLLQEEEEFRQSMALVQDSESSFNAIKTKHFWRVSERNANCPSRPEIRSSMSTKNPWLRQLCGILWRREGKLVS